MLLTLIPFCVIPLHNRGDNLIIDDSILTDNRLNLTDLGLLVYLLYINPTYYSERTLFKSLKLNGHTSIRSSLKRLTECGYLQREFIRSLSNKFVASRWVLKVPPLSPLN